MPDTSVRSLGASPRSTAGGHWISGGEICDFSIAERKQVRIPAVPGIWTEDGDDVVLTATAEDGLTVDGKPLTGRIRLTADHGPIPESRVAHGERRLVVLRREGLWAVRDFDPDSPARRAFQGIEATAYDARR